jgi:hypothetical protein
MLAQKYNTSILAIVLAIYFLLDKQYISNSVSNN